VCGKLSRNPTEDVIKKLRQEVGFGCPVPGCRNPYLEWHHFDPPWREKNHHDPEGMIALCAEHHKKADNGAFTKEQLHKFKLDAKVTSLLEVKGRFDWLRNKILFVVGGSFYYEIPILIQLFGIPVVSFRRDEEGYLLFNLKMLNKYDNERLEIKDNFWVFKPSESSLIDFKCPPSGKLIEAKYANGNKLKVEFFEFKSLGCAKRKYKYFPSNFEEFNFPLTVLDVNYELAHTAIKFSSSLTHFPGGLSLKACFLHHSPIGLKWP
jgi:hypothetical protein